MAWDRIYSFWCLAMSKTWVLGVSGLWVDFGQVTLPSPHQCPSIMVLMTAISSAKPYESYRLKLLYSSQTQHFYNFLTPLQQTLLLAIRAGCIYSLHSPCRRKWNKIQIRLYGGKAYCLAGVAGEGTGERKMTFVTKVLCDFSLALWKRYFCGQLGRLVLLIMATAWMYW